MTANNSYPDTSRTIPLTLTAKYASTWGSWEGVRELVQNWHDGIYDSVSQRGVSLISKYEIIFSEEGSNHKFKACLVKSDTKEEIVLGRLIYSQFENKLTLVNSCTELHKKILLLGYSGKSSSKEIIGQFGEGLKVGALALVRNGHLVTMETCKDRWMFDLIYNEEFGEKVLTVVVTERLTSEGSDCKAEEENGSIQPSDTCTTITGIEDWKTFLPRFLFLQPPVESVKTQLGSLLLDESLAGQLYVKGLWVSDLRNEDLAAGVNFTSLQLDRDRNAVPKPSEIDHMMSGIWIKAIERRPDLVNRYFHLLKSERYRDVRHAAEYSTDELAKKIASEFLNEFGDLAFPMLNSSSAKRMAAVSVELNLTTILCNQTMYEILMKSGSYRSLESALEEHRAKQRKAVAFFSLTQIEVAVLQTAVELAKLVDTSVEISMLDIIETSLTETCSSDGTRICVPRWYLDKDGVHKRGSLCGRITVTKGTAACKCCEVVLCAAVLDLRKEGMYTPLMYLVQELLSKDSTQEPCSSQSEITGGDSSLNNVVFIAREMKLMEKIQQLEDTLSQEKQAAMDKLLIVKEKLKNAEHHLTCREITIIDEETRIRESYKTEIEQWKKKSQAKVEELERLLAKKDDIIMNLQTTVDFKQTELSIANKQVEASDAAAERKVGCLVDELTHYISQNRNRTKSLSKLCAEQCQSTGEDGETREKWQLLQELCDTILQELQEEKVLCSVCKRKRKECIIQPCGHYCLCGPCAHTLMSSRQDCPICRSQMDICLKVYEA